MTTASARARPHRRFDAGGRVLNRVRLLMGVVEGGGARALAVIGGISLAVVVNASMASFWAGPGDVSVMSYDYALVPNGSSQDSAEGDRTLSLLRAQSDVVTVYDRYAADSWLTVAKDAFAPDAARILAGSPEFGNRMKDALNRRVTLPVLVLGYGTNELRMLGSGIAGLNYDECIVLDSSFAKFGVVRLFAHQDTPLVLQYDMTTAEGVQVKAAPLSARFSVQYPLFPENLPDYTLVIIVGLDRFHEMFPSVAPSAYFLDANSAAPSAREQILGIVTGSGYFDVVDEQLLAAERARNTSLSRFLFGFFVGLTALFSIVNVFSLFMLKFRSEAERYSTYLVLGMGRGDMMVAFAAQAAGYYVAGLGVSYAGLLVAERALDAALLGSGLNYSVSISNALWVVFQGGLLATLLAVMGWVFLGLRRLRPDVHSVEAE